MNGKTGGTPGPRRAGALAVVAAVAALATSCGVVHVHVGSSGGTASPASATFVQLVTFAQCMRSHGVPGFPDPNPSGGFNLTTTPNGPKEAIDINSGQVQATYGTCRHLLPGGGPSIAHLQQQAQQEQQKNLPALLKFSRCMRSHGVPNFPDPPASDQATPVLPKGAAINPESPQFQVAVRACQHVLPAGAHISVGTHASVGTHGL